MTWLICAGVLRLHLNNYACYDWSDMNTKQVARILREKKYKPSFVELEPRDVFVAYLLSRRGLNDRTLESRFKRSQLVVVGYGHCIWNGHYMKLRERR